MTITDDDVMNQVCTNCKIPKKLESFHKNKNMPLGYDSCCKSCANERKRLRRKSLKLGIPVSDKKTIERRNRLAELFKAGLRECSRCSEVKPLDEFYNTGLSSISKSSQCKCCIKSAAVKRYALNKSAALSNDLKNRSYKSIETEALASVGLKLCIGCGLTKSLSDYTKNRKAKSGKQGKCRSCLNEHRRRARIEALKNSPAARKRHKELKKIHDNRWYCKNKTNPDYRLSRAMRNMLRRHAKYISSKKEPSTSKALGYTPEKLRERIEFGFKPGMSWDNYGDWHIDHKIPVSHFLRRGESRPHIINALSNLKPLWGAENSAKGNRFTG